MTTDSPDLADGSTYIDLGLWAKGRYLRGQRYPYALVLWDIFVSLTYVGWTHRSASPCWPGLVANTRGRRRASVIKWIVVACPPRVRIHASEALLSLTAADDPDVLVLDVRSD
ncbi:hypothetical protein [Nocardiopsis sp. ATB16-24]|uniref:hypothetical protein n=1 Tax=Nocardiopsis sp. ATB16-24 TaxID=3019555 RepID=UPI0025552B9F|nr:hypothetical protein [Nocardiopsis sp. ATB16-24]